MAGRFIAVVGPSGVGKDSVIDALCVACPGMRRVRRVVTRAPGTAEDHDSLTPADFAAAVAAGDFALHWQAHGLSYGIPRGIDADLAAGADVIGNLSRGVLTTAAARFPRFEVLALSAAPETLAARLAARGRETQADIAARIARDAALPEGLTIHRIANDGALADTVSAARRALYPEKS